jgi:phosphate:Na+ symporter
MDHEARLIPFSNFGFRAVAGLAAMLLIWLVPLPYDRLGATEAGQLVNLHLLFNLALVLLALPFIRPMERLVRLLIRDPVAEAGRAPVRPASALDPAALGTPPLAIAAAKREVLRMGELVETMFRPVMDILDAGSPDRLAQVRAQEAEVDRIHTEIKLYIAELRRAGLSPDEAQRGIELTDVAISLEHIGDIIAKSLLGLAEKKKARGQRFSQAGWAEMTALRVRVSANMQMAMNVLVSGDLESARTLAAEKEALRGLERESLDRHLARLQSGQADSIETSALHLEAVRALKEVNSLLVTVAYPILAESGQLLTSRLTPAR